MICSSISIGLAAAAAFNDDAYVYIEVHTSTSISVINCVTSMKNLSFYYVNDAEPVPTTLHSRSGTVAGDDAISNITSIYVDNVNVRMYVHTHRNTIYSFYISCPSY